MEYWEGCNWALMATYALANMGFEDFNWHKSHYHAGPSNSGTSKAAKKQKAQRKARKQNRRK